MFYVFVLGCGLVVALVVALLRGDVPAARGWTLLLIGSPVIGPIATVLAGPLGLPEGVDVRRCGLAPRCGRGPPGD